jgi:hypothetical protein
MQQQLFALASISSSLAQNAVLVSIASANERFGPGFFGCITFSTFAPALPVALFQLYFDKSLDARFGLRRAHRFRCQSSIVCLVLLVLLFPEVLISDQAPTLRAKAALVGTCALIGAFSFVLFGSLQQVAGLVENRLRLGGAFPAAFAFGHQASGLSVFVAEKAANFDHDADLAEARLFYRLIACVLVLCLVSVQRFFHASWFEDALANDLEQTSMLAENDVDLLPTAAVPAKHMSWKLVHALFVTVFASGMLVPLYARYHGPTDPDFPQAVFLTRLFSDTLSRPATLLAPTLLASDHSLFLSANARLVLLCPLLWYAYAYSSAPHAKFAILACLSLYSFASGFIVTRAFQLAARMPQQQTPRLNVIFALALFFGVACGALLNQL